MGLKDKAVAAFFWSFLDTMGNRLIQFCFGIVLARILSPREYGLLGLVSVFLPICTALVESGFVQALIRKERCSREDYSTVFLFNLAASVALWGVLCLASGPLAGFFGEPMFAPLLCVLGGTLVLNGLSVVQRVVLIRDVDFRLQAKISFAATIVSNVVGIALALRGYGVWSLVWRQVAESLVSSLLLWVFSSRAVGLVFSRASFGEMFGFGSRMLASRLIDGAYGEMYKVVVGKFFSVTDLGYYTRAVQFSEMPSSGLTTIVQKVTAPVLARFSGLEMKPVYRRLQGSVALVVFTLMAGMAGVADTLVLALLGPKWEPAAPLLTLLCLATALYPIHALNLQVIWIQGMSGLFLRLEIIKKLIEIPVVVVGIFFGIKAMLVGMLVNSLVAYFINSHHSGELIGYSSFDQLKDLLPSVAVAALTGSGAWLVGTWVPWGAWPLLCLQVAVGAAVALAACLALRVEAFLEIRNILTAKGAQWLKTR